MEMLKQRAQIDLLHVPFKAAARRRSRSSPARSPSPSAATPSPGNVRAGKLRALAVAGKQRSAAFSDVPRLAEFYPGFEVTPWLALFAPAGVPGPVMARLREATNTLARRSAMAERIRRVGGLEPYVSTPMNSPRCCARNTRATARSSNGRREDRLSLTARRPQSAFCRVEILQADVVERLGRCNAGDG